MCRFAGTWCGSLQSGHLIGKILVGHTPVDHGLGGLAAAGADIAQVLLLKGHAAAGQASFLFHLHLAGEVTAPHGLDAYVGVGLGQLCASSMVVADRSASCGWRGHARTGRPAQGLSWADGGLSSSRETNVFCAVSRRTRTHWFFPGPLGPISSGEARLSSPTERTSSPGRCRCHPAWTRRVLADLLRQLSGFLLADAGLVGRR